MKLNQFASAFICLISLSCNGQVKTDAPKEIRTQRTEQPKLRRTQGTDEYANVHCSLEDKNGNLWFGTTGEGLYKYDGKEFTNFLEKDGLSSNNVWCAYEDKSGKLWFGTDDGVCCFDPENDSKPFTTFRVEESLAVSRIEKNAVRSIFQDKRGEFWFGTDIGVFKSNSRMDQQTGNGTPFVPFFNGSNFNGSNMIINKQNLKLRAVSAILEDKSGKMWFASWNNEGACCYDGKSLTSFNPNGDNMVYSLLEDKEGNLWFGTREHGVCRYDGIGAQKSYTNFADIATLSTSCVYSMVEDKDGTIWLGTEFGSGSSYDKQGGVWRYDPVTNAFTNFTAAGDGLTNNSVFTVLKNHSDEFWFGTRNVGLCKFDPTVKGKKFIVFSE
jgi:ligand-binding sensor domain-containing protein